jgi:YD repeat-containing protein
MRLALLLVAAAAGAQSLPQWRLSDALGTDLGPAPLARSNASHWTLRVEQRGEEEEQVLFENGSEKWTRLVDRDVAGRALRVRELRDGEPLWDVTYHPETGLPDVETTFTAGTPLETAQLTFEDRVLSRREVKDDSGTTLYIDTLYRWPDGTLRRVERDGPGGPLAEAAWNYSGGKLAGAWAAGEGELAQGRHREWTFAAGTTNEILATETQTLLTRVSEAGDAGRKETLTDAKGRVETRLTDTQGHLTGEMVTVKGTLVEVRRWTYDAQGRVLESSTESAGPPESWSYTYNADGTILSRLSRAGVMIKEVLSRGGETLTVSLYDRGSLFLIETWNAGRRVKEAYYKDGSVIRERIP